MSLADLAGKGGLEREAMFVASDDLVASVRKPCRERHNVCLELCQEVRDELRPTARLMTTRTWHLMGYHNTNDDTKECSVTPLSSFERIRTEDAVKRFMSPLWQRTTADTSNTRSCSHIYF